MTIRRFLFLSVALSFLASCGDSILEERHEHGNVTCVYEVERNFWGVTESERVVACDESVQGG